MEKGPTLFYEAVSALRTKLRAEFQGDESEVRVKYDPEKRQRVLEVLKKKRNYGIQRSVEMNKASSGVGGKFSSPAPVSASAAQGRTEIKIPRVGEGYVSKAVSIFESKISPSREPVRRKSMTSLRREKSTSGGSHANAVRGSVADLEIEKEEKGIESGIIEVPFQPLRAVPSEGAEAKIGGAGAASSEGEKGGAAVVGTAVERDQILEKQGIGLVKSISRELTSNIISGSSSVSSIVTSATTSDTYTSSSETDTSEDEDTAQDAAAIRNISEESSLGEPVSGGTSATEEAGREASSESTDDSTTLDEKLREMSRDIPVSEQSGSDDGFRDLYGTPMLRPNLRRRKKFRSKKEDERRNTITYNTGKNLSKMLAEEEKKAHKALKKANSKVFDQGAARGHSDGKDDNDTATANVGSSQTTGGGSKKSVDMKRLKELTRQKSFRMSKKRLKKFSKIFSSDSVIVNKAEIYTYGDAIHKYIKKGSKNEESVILRNILNQEKGLELVKLLGRDKSLLHTQLIQTITDIWIEYTPNTTGISVYGIFSDNLARALINELSRTVEDSTILRGNTIAVSLIKSFMGADFKKYFQTYYIPLINLVMSEVKRHDNLSDDQEYVESFTSDVIDIIVSTDLSPRIKFVLSLIRSVLTKYRPTLEEKNKNAIVNSFFFLRFLTPFMGSPELSDKIKPGAISLDMRRMLTRLAQLIQSISNNSLYTTGTSMEKYNSFIGSNFERVNDFMLKNSKFEITFDENGEIQKIHRELIEPEFAKLSERVKRVRKKAKALRKLLKKESGLINSFTQA